MLLEIIEALPEVRAARYVHASAYVEADELEQQAYMLVQAADARLMKILGKRYLGAWWEFEGKFRKSCGFRRRNCETKGYCPVKKNAWPS